MDRHARNLGYQSLGQATYFGVIRRHGGQWTAVAPNDERTILLFKLRETAQLVEYVGGCLGPRACRLSIRSCFPPSEDLPISVAHPIPLVQAARPERPGAGRARVGKPSGTGLRPPMSARVHVGRLTAAAATAYRTSLPHKAVALKDGEMRADAVVRKTQHPGELLDGAPRAPEQRDNLTPHAFQELPVAVVRSQ